MKIKTMEIIFFGKKNKKVLKKRKKRNERQLQSNN